MLGLVVKKKQYPTKEEVAQFRSQCIGFEHYLKQKEEAMKLSIYGRDKDGKLIYLKDIHHGD